MNKLSWKVLFHNFNKNKIEYYDIFANGSWEEKFRSLKATTKDFSEWEHLVRQELKSRYWSRSEYETVITSWPPYMEVDEINKLKKEVDDKERIYGKAPYRLNINLTVGEKIDIFSQIEANWNVFIQYIWNYFNKEKNK